MNFFRQKCQGGGGKSGFPKFKGDKSGFPNFKGGGGGLSWVSSITNQPKEVMNEQLKELSTNLMLETMCPSLSTLENVCLTIPVGTVFVERSFSQ